MVGYASYLLEAARTIEPFGGAVRGKYENLSTYQGRVGSDVGARRDRDIVNRWVYRICLGLGSCLEWGTSMMVGDEFITAGFSRELPCRLNVIQRGRCESGR